METDDVRDRLPDSLADVEFEDRLEVLGLAVGAFLVLAGIGTVLGAPWQYRASTLAAVVQVVGALGTAAVGAGLVWLVQTQRER